MKTEWIGKRVFVVCSKWYYEGELLEIGEQTIAVRVRNGIATIHSGTIESITVYNEVAI